MAKRNTPEVESSLPQVKRQKIDKEVTISGDESASSGSVDKSISPEISSGTGAKNTRTQRVRKQPGAKAACRIIGPALGLETAGKIVQSKIQQVLQFNIQNTPTKTFPLERCGDNCDHAIVTELAALGALMRMRSDYEVSDPTRSSLEYMRQILVKTLERRLGNNPSVKYVALDLTRLIPLEVSIHLKIEGHGLERVGLLKTELEMLARDTEAAAANNLCRHVQNVYDESDSSLAVSVANEVAERSCKTKQSKVTA